MRMPEPMHVAKWSVGLNRSPAPVSVAINHIPILIIDEPSFITGPARIAVFEQSGIGEHYRVRLISSERLNNLLEIVDVSRAARAIKPEFNEVAIALGQLLQF